MKKYFSYFFMLAIIVSFFGCAKNQGQDNTVIATINGEPVYVREVKAAIALNMRKDPFFKVTPQTLDEQLNTIIDKRLLIQEAKKKKLDRTDKFVNSIKAYWEQTLIRDLVSYKEKEIEKKTGAQKEETRQRQVLLNQWLNEVREKANVKINDKVLKETQERL